MSENLVEVKNLNTAFITEGKRVQVLDNVSFEIKKGKTLGIVGESGCGKSVTSLSMMRLLPRPAGVIESGEILIATGDTKTDIVTLDASELYSMRGQKISMIFQEPMTALNPVHKIGKQLAECYELHFPDMSTEEIKKAARDILDNVGIPLPEKRLNEYAHQLSGGMRQRVMIAMALACKPDLIIADEPTTALDVTIQAQILRLMKKLQEERGTAIMFITHDLGVIAEICDDVVVMYCGQVVEKANVFELFKNPRHPYTKGLLNSIPKLDNPSKCTLEVIEGMVPDLRNLPTGCRFQNRCPYADESCKSGEIEIVSISDDHEVRCHKWKEVENK